MDVKLVSLHVTELRKCTRGLTIDLYVYNNKGLIKLEKTNQASIKQLPKNYGRKFPSFARLGK